MQWKPITRPVTRALHSYSGDPYIVLGFVAQPWKSCFAFLLFSSFCLHKALMSLNIDSVIKGWKSFLSHTAACMKGTFGNYCDRKKKKMKSSKALDVLVLIEGFGLVFENKMKNEFHLSFWLDFALLHLLISILSVLMRQLRFLYFPT